MTQNPLMQQYETLADTMQLVVDAARMGDWEYYDELQARYDSYIALMKARGPYPPLTEMERQRKFEIITRMLTIDREIQTIAESLIA